MWQEHKHGDWKTYSLAEIRVLNKAAAKGQKKITLPSTVPTEKATICFEKMLSKNKATNDERKVRCLILNNKSVYAVWSWTESNRHNLVSYPPHLTYFLETMFQKDVPKVDFHYKTELEVDFLNRTITDKDTKVVFSIHREEIDFVDTRWNQKDLKKHVVNIVESERLMKAIITYSIDRYFVFPFKLKKIVYSFL